MGKSTAMKSFMALGFPAVDTDDLARGVVSPGSEGLAAVVSAFGPRMLTPENHLDRRALAEVVFSDSAQLRLLESILHPRIRALWVAMVQQWRQEDHKFGMVVIPLLFEIGSKDSFDCTVCVACSEKSQTKRLLERGWSLDDVRKRCSAQWDPERKLGAADTVIWTEGDLRNIGEQWDRILRLETSRQSG